MKGRGLLPRRRRRSVIWLLVGLALVLAVLNRYKEPLRRYFWGVKKEVVFAGQSMEGLFAFEVARVVDQVAKNEGREPVDAVLDEEKEGIIPELNGIAVDREATVEAIMKARRGERIDPVYAEVLPSLRWEHYPERPVFQGNPGKPMVSFMINVAWGEEYLEEMLRILAEHQAKATFFLTGRWAEKNPELVRRIAAEEHELGNHGYSDGELFSEMEAEAMAASLRRTNEVVFSACGRYPYYFTPHKGEYSPLALQVVSRQGMRTVMWTLDTVDWSKPGVEQMKAKILNGVGPGSIILMHPTEDTLALLREILPVLKEKELAVVTVGELLSPSWFFRKR